MPDALDDQFIVCAHPEHLGSDQCYWPPGTVVTWHQACQFPGMPPATVEADIARGLSRWSEICGVQFQRVPSPSQARVAISSQPIDGPMNVLGETQLPCSRRADVQCWMHLDNKEPWNQSIDLAAVVCHEMGHGIGLGHAPQGSANVMAPIYRAGQGFGPWDKQQSIQRYGQVKPATPPAPTDPPTTGDPASFVARGSAILRGQAVIVTFRGTLEIAGR
jgi:hypothetical protein